jgi:CBS domain containing-hemolysin-like protein
MLFAIGMLLLFLIFLAVAEMALSRMSKPKASALADSGAAGGAALVKLVAHPERWVNPLLLTVNVCQTVQATLTGVVAARLFGTAGVIIGVALNVVVFFVLAEAVPKTYAVQHSERAALRTSRLTYFIVTFAPLQAVSRGLIGLTNIIVRGKGLKEGPFVSEQELLGIVEAAAEEQVIEHEERELIESIIEFGDTVVREIMTPRPDVVAVDHDVTIDRALDIAMGDGYSRLPVLREMDDHEDIVGIVYTKDLMREVRTGNGAATVAGVVRRAIVIPENKPVSKLMRDMQREHFHMAIIADEYGSIAGLVTLEDCLEELVGEIVDEFDETETMIRHMPNGDTLVLGAMSIADFNEHFDTRLPDEEWDTIAGFLFGTLEHVPVIGESVEQGGWRFAAEEVAGRRIVAVRVSPVVPTD